MLNLKCLIYLSPEAVIKLTHLGTSTVLAITMITLVSLDANAGTREQAYRLHNRLAGVPPTATILNEMDILIKNGQPKAAALKAMENKNYYDLVLANWFKRFTNVDDSSRVRLTDYVATAVGIVRDDIPFDQVLYGDHLYLASPAASTTFTIPAYSLKNNDHFFNVEAKYVSLKENLVRMNQSEVSGIADTAGVLTTRGAAVAFFSNGTNRRMTRYTFMNYLCRDFEALHDINITDYHVRRDVERNPGGDSRTYKSQCVGCHAGQDALGGAWAHFDFVNDELKYTPKTVVAKINKNNLFEYGYVTTNDEWVNLWAEGQNASLGWPSKVAGKGAKELGMMIARSRAFSECMSTRVFELVCMRKPKVDQEKKDIKKLADTFQQNANYNMKNLFAETSLLCMGD